MIANGLAASLPFTFRVGAGGEREITSLTLPIERRAAPFREREDGGMGFTGGHAAVMVLAGMALLVAGVLVAFSMRKGRRQEREAKERGAFVRGLQVRGDGAVKAQAWDGR